MAGAWSPRRAAATRPNDQTWAKRSPDGARSAVHLIDGAARLRTAILDLVVGGRSYAQSTTLGKVIHEMHGDLVMDLNSYSVNHGFEKGAHHGAADALTIITATLELLDTDQG